MEGSSIDKKEKDEGERMDWETRGNRNVVCAESQVVDVETGGEKDQQETVPRVSCDLEDEAVEEEEDDVEGIRKSLKKGIKIVKDVFLKEEHQGKGDNVNSEAESQNVEPGASPRYNWEDEYNFTYPKRGLAIIINNEKFHSSSTFENRPGSSEDAKALEEVFKKLQFDVKCFKNLTAFEMEQTLMKESHLYNHSKADCVAVAILSHGDFQLQAKAWSYRQQQLQRFKDVVHRDVLFGVDGICVFTDTITRMFQDERCPGLKGKPRLFFIQACRGTDYDDGLDVAVIPDDVTSQASDDDLPVDTEEIDARSSHSHRKTVFITPAPIFKDFLVMYATTPGHFAWRRPTGTWFVKSLHEVFTRQLTSSLSLTQALTRVAGLVARNYQSNSSHKQLTGKKQNPVVQSMLVKEVYFSKK